MKSLNAPVVEHSELASKSSSSMSRYDSDLEDVEIELRRELIRLNNVRPKIVVRPVKDTKILWKVIATLGPILKFQLSWKSSNSQLTRWGHGVALLSEQTTHPPAHPQLSFFFRYITDNISGTNPLIFSNFKLKLRGKTESKKCLKWRGPILEDDLKM